MRYKQKCSNKRYFIVTLFKLKVFALKSVICPKNKCAKIFTI